MAVDPPKTWAEVPVYVRAVLASPFAKAADDGDPSFGVPGLSQAADVLGWRAGSLNAMWGGPRPLANLLIGSGVGAGGGYLAGHLASKILPKKYFDREAVRRRAMLLGAAVGSVVPAYQMYDAHKATGDLGSVLEPYPPPPDRWKVAGAWTKDAIDMFAPVIPVDPFNRAVMADQNTPWNMRAATAGLVEAADSVRGTGDRYISPWNVAQIAVGAGAGLLSGVIAGKSLGLLAGLTPYAQERIQDLGLWSGVVQAVVPRALGFR